MIAFNQNSSARTRLRWAACVVLCCVLGLLIYNRVMTPLSQDRAQSLMVKDFVPALLNGLGPVGYPIDEGTAIALLEVDKLGLEAIVVEGTQSEDLAKGPGHLIGSALPGQPGTSAILAHSNIYGSTFARLNELLPGNDISLTTGQGKHNYKVLDSTVRSADDAAAFLGERNMLLLITGGGGTSPNQRLVVRAELTSAVFPSGLVDKNVRTSTSELGLEGSSQAPRQVLLWLLLLFVLLLISTPIIDFVGTRVGWLLCAPVLLVVALQIWRNASLMFPAIG